MILNSQVAELVGKVTRGVKGDLTEGAREEPMRKKIMYKQAKSRIGWTGYIYTHTHTKLKRSKNILQSVSKSNRGNTYSVMLIISA